MAGSLASSTGGRSELRSVSGRSFTQVSRAERGETFSTPVRVPSSGLPAPYGSALALRLVPGAARPPFNLA